MGNKDKNKDQGDSGTSEGATGGDITSSWDALHANHDLSWEREAREAALAKQVAEAMAREKAKAHVHYQALLNERSTAVMPTSLKMISGTLGFKVMDPFDWTKDKAIYQRWQLWSEKTRHTLEAMEGDSEKTKISYFHHWIDSEGMAKTESWKNSKTLISQKDCEKLDEDQKIGKDSLDKIESYFILFESLLALKSNPLLAVEELHFTKQGSMNSVEFYAHVVKIAKRCKFSCVKAEERAIRHTIFLGMNSTKTRNKAINLINEKGKELTVDFLMQQLVIKDCNAHHKSLSQLDSSMSINFATYDCRQNKGKSNKKNRNNGKDWGQNNSGAQGSSYSSHQSRKPPGMGDKCMRCGKQESQPGQKCPTKNAKCKDCHKIGHFHKVCQSKKMGKQRANLVQILQDDDDTHIDENGVRQPNLPRVNMLKLVNHIEANREGKHLKFPIASHPKGPYKHHIVVRVERGADVNCMNKKTFNELFPEVQLSVCPHEIQNFRNSVADISILEQFCTYLEFRGEKYLNTFIVTNANDCPNLLSYGATFRMGVLLPNYPQKIVVKRENVPHFSKMSGVKTGNGTSNGTSNGISYVNTGNGTASSTSISMSNVFQILNDIQKR